MAIDAKQIVCDPNEETVMTLLKKLIAGSTKDIVGVNLSDFDATGNGKIFPVTTGTISGSSPTNKRNAFYKYTVNGYYSDLTVKDYVPEKLEFLLSDGTTREFPVEWSYIRGNGNETVTTMNNRQLSWATTAGTASGALLFREESADDERYSLISEENAEKAYIQLYASVKELPNGITDTYGLTKNAECKLHVMAKTIPVK